MKNAFFWYQIHVDAVSTKQLKISLKAFLTQENLFVCVGFQLNDPDKDVSIFHTFTV